MVKKVEGQFRDAETVERPEPLPLSRKGTPPAPFPVKCLGPVLAGATRAIVDKVQCPEAIASQSVLAAASLATQALADVVHPATGQARPISLFIVTVASSGERKSAADQIALEPIKLREAELHEKYETDRRKFQNESEIYQRSKDQILRKVTGDRAEAQKQLMGLGNAPAQPLTPLLTVPEPTIEGLHKLMSNCEPSMALFNDEGGSFIGGYGMSDEARLRTGAALSSFWDGSPVKRVRGGDGVSILRGRRLSIHIMVQPGIADALIADDVLIQQGFTSRLLISAPVSLAGLRLQKELKKGTERALKQYCNLLLSRLRAKQPRRTPTNPELQPRPLPLSKAARSEWKNFADDCEKALGPEGRFEPIRAFANKLAEHALRIAAVLQLVENPNATEISVETFKRAVMIAEYYASEALRLFEQGSASVGVQQAGKVLRWLQNKWCKPLVGLADIYQFGPNSVREARLAREAMAVLEQHFWAYRIEGGAEIDGKRHRESWQIVPPV